MSEPIPDNLEYQADWDATPDELYEIHAELFNENNLFYHAMACYLIRRAAGEEIPEDLLQAIECRFHRAVYARSVQDARNALGVGHTKDGGPGQWKRAIKKYSQAARLSFLDKTKQWGGAANFQERINFVAQISGTTPGALKTLYHEKLRRKKSE